MTRRSSDIPQLHHLPLIRCGCFFFFFGKRWKTCLCLIGPLWSSPYKLKDIRQRQIYTLVDSKVPENFLLGN